MAFQTHVEFVKNIAKITLSGRLDTPAAPLFQSAIETVIDRKVKRLVLLLNELTYISSSGLRVLVYYKQKMGPLVDIYAIAPQPLVDEVFKMTGFQNILVLKDDYNAEDIENV